MSRISHLVKKHQELLGLQENPTPDFYEKINEFLDDVQRSGRDIENPELRDQLRSYLRFWSTVSYEINTSSGYRIVELDEFVGKKSFLYRNKRFIIQSIIFFILLTVIIGLITFISSLTQTASPIIHTLSYDSISTITERIPPTATATPFIILTQSSSPTPIITFDTSITSPINGSVIYPELEISGTYTNIPEGTSLHVLIQALNQGDITFVVPEYVTILPNQSSGNWKINANLENIFSLDEFDTTFIITIGFVQSDEIREQLMQEGVSGFAELPQGVFQFSSQPITVTGKKFQFSDEPRLVYVRYDIKNKQMDIYMAHEDGSEAIQITNTLDISESIPTISPDGNWIAFIGKESTPESSEMVFSIWIMDTNGSNRYLLLKQKQYEYSDLNWSPDGDKILFTAKYIGNSDEVNQIIFMLSGITKKIQDHSIQLKPISIPLESGSNRSPRWLSNNEILYVNWSLENQIEGIYLYDFETLENKLKLEIPGTTKDFDIGQENTLVVSMIYKETFDLYLLNLDEGKLIPLVVNSSGYDIWPCWSSDYKKVYFTTNRDEGNNSIWSVDIASGVQTLILQPLTYQPNIGLVNGVFPDNE